MELGFILGLERSQVYTLGLGSGLVQSQGQRVRQDSVWAVLLNRGAWGTQSSSTLPSSTAHSMSCSTPLGLHRIPNHTTSLGPPSLAAQGALGKLSQTPAWAPVFPLEPRHLASGPRSTSWP